MQRKPVFGRREGKHRQQKDTKPRWSDLIKKDFSVWNARCSLYAVMRWKML